MCKRKQKCEAVVITCTTNSRTISNVGEGVSVYVVALVLKYLLVCLTILCMLYSVVK